MIYGSISSQSAVAAKFFYAVVVTIVVVFVTVRLGRLAERVKKDEEGETSGS